VLDDIVNEAVEEAPVPILRAPDRIAVRRPEVGESEGSIPSIVFGTLRGHFRITEMAPVVGELEGSIPAIVK